MENLGEVIFNEYEIQARVSRVADEINCIMKEKEDDGIVVVGVLNGAYVFMADIVRHLNFDLEVDFIQASSYKNSMQSSGYIKIEKDLTCILKDKHVLIVEDIADTGRTLTYLKKLFLEREAKSVSICALLVKNHKDVKNLVDYKCFDCPDEFIVGYGLDYRQKYRNLPYITSININHQR